MPHRVWAFPALILVLSPWNVRADGPDDDEFFEKSVRPILAGRCLKCHGGAKTKGGLRLSSRDALLNGGETGPAAVPLKPGESLLVQAIQYVDDPKMPPDGKLSGREIAALTRWVELGLPWPSSDPAKVPAVGSRTAVTDSKPEKWAFQPPRPQPVPGVQETSWPRSDIDRFILAKLEAAGLKPAPPAAKRTLIRRATFDLTGLPPTPAEVEAFLKDLAPDAFDKVVDRLLSSPAYGERWARRWLDVVRYADSLDTRGSGLPGDILDAWRYRDWVVQALNEDMPYDKFVRDQVAGDLLPPESAADGTEGFNRRGTIATTMLAIGNWGNGDADKEKILTDIADDQVDVVSKAFLGLTVACARCHDHKFDPISQADYYGLAGIFFSTHVLPALTPKGAGETIIRVPLASPAEVARRAERDRRIAALEKALKGRREALYRVLAASLKPQAGRYLLAAYDYQTRPADRRADSVADYAKARGLVPFALRQWTQALGGADARPLSKTDGGVGGVAGVLARTAAPPSASATANQTGLPQQILTFRLPPRSISVHPGPASAAVVSWRSPIAGKVRVTGRIADSDAACGNGVSWVVEHHSPLGMVELASGEIANAGSTALAQSKDAEPLASVAVAPGERIELRVLPKGEYSCDTTTVDLVIASRDGPESWDLTRDCLDDFQAGNPHADRLGHAGVWGFEDAPNPRTPGGPVARALSRWRQALAGGTDRAAVERAAEALGQSFPLDGESSPFWIKDPADDSALPPAALAALASDVAELATLRAAVPPPLEYANSAQEGGVPGSPHAGTHDVKVHLRGRYDRLGDLVPRHFPTALAGAKQPPIAAGSGRVELARWLTRPDNPLTARVLVNRVWQGHFGEGLVRTPSNFGKLGDAPSHPELLDRLAVGFAADGWSIKALHREIMLSATYQQSSTPSADALRVDGDNRLLSRQNRRRLEAEVLRDNLLAAAGRLDRTAGGPADRDADTARRGLYLVTIRSVRSTVAALFDQADSTAPVDRRVESTVAPQSLYFMNHPFVIAQADALARRLLALPGGDAARLTRAYELLFGRPPTAEELRAGLDAVGRPGETRETAWRAYGQVLLCANEFLYVD